MEDKTMPKVSLEIDTDTLITLIQQLPDEEKQRIRETIRPKSHWLKRLYDLYLPMRKEAQKYTDEEVEKDIQNAIKEIRTVNG
jgi:hypothetical protein